MNIKLFNHDDLQSNIYENIALVLTNMMIRLHLNQSLYKPAVSFK